MVGGILLDGRRMALDALVRQILDPGFLLRYRRVPVAPASSGHVNPSMLQYMPPRSAYVRRWRKHARRCPVCAAVFQSLGFPVK